MSILLVNPPYARKVYGTKQAPSVRPPLGLAYVAAGLEEAGLKVDVLDANAEYLTPKETAKKIYFYRRPACDLYGGTDLLFNSAWKAAIRRS